MSGDATPPKRPEPVSAGRPARRYRTQRWELTWPRGSTSGRPRGRTSSVRAAPPPRLPARGRSRGTPRSPCRRPRRPRPCVDDLETPPDLVVAQIEAGRPRRAMPGRHQPRGIPVAKRLEPRSHQRLGGRRPRASVRSRHRPQSAVIEGPYRPTASHRHWATASMQTTMATAAVCPRQVDGDLWPAVGPQVSTISDDGDRIRPQLPIVPGMRPTQQIPDRRHQPPGGPSRHHFAQASARMRAERQGDPASPPRRALEPLVQTGSTTAVWALPPSNSACGQDCCSPAKPCAHRGGGAHRLGVARSSSPSPSSSLSSTTRPGSSTTPSAMDSAACPTRAARWRSSARKTRCLVRPAASPSRFVAACTPVALSDRGDPRALHRERCWSPPAPSAGTARGAGRPSGNREQPRVRVPA